MDCSENINDLWKWQEEEYSLQDDSQNGYSHYLWNDANQGEDSLMYMLGEQTPIKDCTEFGYHVPDTAENANKALEECRESSQLKRRRMLQYDSNATDTSIGNEQFSYTVQSKVVQELLMDDILPGNVQSEPGFSGTSRSIGHECLDRPSHEWLSNCYGEGRFPFHCDEMMSCEGEIDISDYCNIPPETEADEVPKITTPLSRIKFKGRRFIETPTKLVTSVAYPFALIKPSHIQGDTTLGEINQRIHTPPKPKDKNDEDPTLCYPTSAFSGKPVVSKTKIRTEGGKGSITIMRTKG